MPIVVSCARKQYAVPSEGTTLAVLADVVDLGRVETAYGSKVRIRFKWFVEQTDENGNHLSLIQSFNKSLHEKSTLRKTIKSILGRDPGDRFDLETLIGSNARLVIEHTEHDGRTYANVTAVIRPERGAVVMTIPDGFTRAQSVPSESADYLN